MSNIHYFQRYSQKENVATNNTLLLFSRLYQNSPIKFKYFFNEILEDIVFEVGIQFIQQLKNNNSVPDGIITQDSFKLVIETKLNSKDFKATQLKKHLTSFNDENFQILLSLSPNKIATKLKNEIKEIINNFNANNNSRITFIDLTFKQVVSTFRTIINDFDFELTDIIDDFEDYCNSSNLINEIQGLMRVIPCGSSLKENLKNDVYYAPSSRGFSDHTYLGLYNNKRVKAIGKISNIITVDFVGNEYKIKQSLSEPTKTEIDNIKNVIIEAKLNNNWDISKKHTFFCVEKFIETEYIKKTKYALQRSKFFNLNALLETQNLPSTDIIAEKLRNEKW